MILSCPVRGGRASRFLLRIAFGVAEHGPGARAPVIRPQQCRDPSTVPLRFVSPAPRFTGMAARVARILQQSCA
ncbi:hypothetical protein C7I55_17175 [Sphingomonas deserti]|uniref:Uncharacterized protein n=1 Tax=Allosphingosinicella deserti TaxID=2116704 RepID=A0A2P7QM39_9SPHN|nr:hypothetical protein C7I55_17175 [Sphingomonas deserti]